jgi:hypothetical protein
MKTKKPESCSIEQGETCPIIITDKFKNEQAANLQREIDIKTHRQIVDDYEPKEDLWEHM